MFLVYERIFIFWNSKIKFKKEGSSFWAQMLIRISPRNRSQIRNPFSMSFMVKVAKPIGGHNLVTLSVKENIYSGKHVFIVQYVIKN